MLRNTVYHDYDPHVFDKLVALHLHGFNLNNTWQDLEHELEQTQQATSTWYWTRAMYLWPVWTEEYSVLHSTIDIVTLANQYTQIDGVHPKITHFKHILGYTFLQIPITYTPKHVFIV